MTSRDFCYWLQGYIEISHAEDFKKGLSASQTTVIARHLALVFKHEIDPQEPGDNAENQAIHDGEPFLNSTVPPSGVLYRC